MTQNLLSTLKSPLWVFEETFECEKDFEKLHLSVQIGLQSLIGKYFHDTFINPKAKVSTSSIDLGDRTLFFIDTINQSILSDKMGYFLLRFHNDLRYNSGRIKEYMEARKKDYMKEFSQISMEFVDYMGGCAGFSWRKKIRGSS